MKIIAYPTTNTPYKIQPANSRRAWMDVAANKNPYRCLPLSMANAWGWEVLSPSHFTAEWNGNRGPGDVKITHIAGSHGAASHFGEGTITWHTGYIFKMPYPYGLYVTGAPNNPVPNVIPLSGVVETNWLAYTFTMNWKFTQPGSFEVKIGDPICQLFPIDLTTFDNLEIEMRTLHEPESKEFHDEYWNWNINRLKYMSEQRAGLHGADVWQRHYFRGVYPAIVTDGEPMEDPSASSKKCPFHITEDGTKESTHRTKPNVPEVVDKQTEPFKTPNSYFEIVKKIDQQRAKEREEQSIEPIQQQGHLPTTREEELEIKLRTMELKLKIAESQLKMQSAQNQTIEVAIEPLKKQRKKKAKVIKLGE